MHYSQTIRQIISTCRNHKRCQTLITHADRPLETYRKTPPTLSVREAKQKTTQTFTTFTYFNHFTVSNKFKTNVARSKIIMGLKTHQKHNVMMMMMMMMRSRGPDKRRKEMTIKERERKRTIDRWISLSCQKQNNISYYKTEALDFLL